MHVRCQENPQPATHRQMIWREPSKYRYFKVLQIIAEERFAPLPRVLQVRFHARMELVFHALNGIAFPDDCRKCQATRQPWSFLHLRGGFLLIDFVFENSSDYVERRKMTHSRGRALIPFLLRALLGLEQLGLLYPYTQSLPMNSPSRAEHAMLLTQAILRTARRRICPSAL